MTVSKSRRNNIIFLIVIALLIIPQTRQPIQIMLHKGLALFSPSVINKKNSEVINNYDWKLKDLDNNQVNLNEYKGQVIFLNLWATWCPPCIAEMPSLQELYHDYNDKIVFLLVTIEETDVIKKFLDKNNYDFDIHQPLSESPEILKSRSIPRTFLIDKEGNILINKSGAANWNSERVRETIDNLLK
ncbi:TlpA disulfide reductase family protein [Yeosuana sp. MJ-SS3]|uniref:TlpA disulfide reductase family protein n=1 Tax=Gilvirhabdus luticola TaxID=3079858 RepID=A0ABU3U6T9_9FLAO|nr:TlpA disulfide reductase family protein [Yeosuana sp. MJ-SS3]MDU8886118.1 TlpA disulfide reductase family protein [Yeosuana sp. MJ-SS3]